MGEQIIGLLLGFSIFLAVLIGIGVTSQTLRGAILSNIREFASLRALGISMGSLRLIVMELSFWVGVAGLGRGDPAHRRHRHAGADHRPADRRCACRSWVRSASADGAGGGLRRDGDGHPEEEPAGGSAAMSHALQPHGLVAERLTKRFKTGRTHVTVLAERRLRGEAGRGDDGHGPVGLRQVDPDRRALGPDAPGRGHGHRRWAPTCGAARPAASTASGSTTAASSSRASTCSRR